MQRHAKPQDRDVAETSMESNIGLTQENASQGPRSAVAEGNIGISDPAGKEPSDTIAH